VSISTMTSKGQVTIPKEIRERLGLKEGDRLVFQFDDQGRLLVRAEDRKPLGRLPGLLRHLAPDRPVTDEEMKEAVKRRAAQRFREKSRR
jgi:antitoxin PrlF